jgi:hypothetical protein
LFRNRVFNVTSAVGFVVGFALFGSVTYLPLFLQVVNGSSPTGSGLQILPLMAGLLITSIGSGQIITRTGQYKVFPIAGTFLMIIGLYLLSRMDASTTRLVSSAYMFVLGLGLGMVMQVLVLAVQNAVDYEDLGVATSGATLFRSIGGSVGTAILGSIFSARLKANLAVNLSTNRATAKIPPAQLHRLTGAIGNPASLKRLPAPVHHVYILSFTHALDRVFVVAAVIAAAAFVLSWLLQQRPLRGTAEASAGLSETFAAPKQGDSLAELSRALSVLLGREGRRHLVEQIAARAGVDLSAAAAWLLVRVYREPATSIEELSEAWDVPLDRARAGLTELIDRGMVSPNGHFSRDIAAISPESPPDGRAVTDLGRETADKLIAERHATLCRLLDGWEPERHSEVTALLTRIADEIRLAPVPEPEQASV